MNQLMNQGSQRRSDQPHEINVNVGVHLLQASLNFQTSVDPEIPFNTFVNGIIEQIFSQRMQPQYDETIEFQLENGAIFQQPEIRTLQKLGFFNNCTLYVRLKLKGGNL